MFGVEAEGNGTHCWTAAGEQAPRYVYLKDYSKIKSEKLIAQE